MTTKHDDHVPSHLQLNLSKYPKLSDKQVGHVRHFHNLVSQLDGSWHHMGGLESMQEFLDAFRYQLAVMSYAVAVTHYHRTPALRSVYKTLFRQIIHKMLRREVWGYWFMTSHAGNLLDPDRTELRKPWADPVVRENIMYSGHLLYMTSLYAMLFDDDEFERPNSLVFTWDPLFWGLGTETFSYDNRSLQQAIIAEMERNNWIGVCCEPNAVFVVCNQFPILAFHQNDVRDNTNITEEILKKYRAAWDAAGMETQDGLFVSWLLAKQRTPFPPRDVPHNVLPPQDVGFTAWAGAYMNAWNSDYVKSKFDQHATGFITNIGGQITMQPLPIATAFRALVNKHGHPPDSAETLKQAIEDAKTLPTSEIPFHAPTYGCVVQWLSELGKNDELDALLHYADTRLKPTWENGGLFYPRNDKQSLTEWTHMDPFTGNASIGYARLNVPDGQKIMTEQPWTRELLAARPYIDGVDMQNGVDYLRGVWDESEKALILTVRTWDGSAQVINPVVKNLEPGAWAIYLNNEIEQVVMVEEIRGSISISVSIEEEEIDIIFKKV